jgi:hypothetical protein
VVFAYDVENRELLWQIVPVPGEGAIGEIAFDNRGTLWSHTTVTSFSLDTDTHEVTNVRNYQDYPWGDVDHAWVAARLWIDPYDGLLHAITQGSMYKIDRTTLDRARWFRPASFGFLHNNGNIYLARDPKVWEYTPSVRPTAAVSVEADEVAPCAKVAAELSGFGPGELVETWLRPTAAYLESIHAKTGGDLSYQFTVPGDAPAGANRLEVKRVLTGRTVTAEFDVAEPRPETEHDTIVFSDRNSGVTNYERPNGCSFLDEVWLRAPFASHGDFVGTVDEIATAWEADGLLTEAEGGAVVSTAARAR